MRTIIHCLRNLLTAAFIAVMLLNCGCVNPGMRRNVDVLVVDAETNRPVSDAKISVGPMPLILSVPVPREDQTATTDRTGQATIAAPKYLFPIAIDWNVHAEGYSAVNFFDGTRVPGEIEASAGMPFTRPRVTVRLFREPGPSVTVMVPDGYRGPIFIDLVPEETPDSSPIADIPPRHFTFLAAPKGYVKIGAVPILADKPYMYRPRWHERISISEVGGREIRNHTLPIGHIEFKQNPMLRWIATQKESDTRARHLFYLGDLAARDAFEAELKSGQERETRIAALFTEAASAAAAHR